MGTYLSELLCTNCQTAGLDLQTEATAICLYCGTVNQVAGLICPYCDFVNAAEAQACDGCHQSLYRTCARCGTPNWAGTERCQRCQGALDSVALLSARYRVDTAGRLRAQQHDAPVIKAREAVDSQRRMGELNAIEERRQQNISDAVRTRDRQQRLWMGALIVLSCIVIAGTVIFLAFLSSH